MTMSDTKALNLTSLVTKKTRRAKARLMQNFGKADKTTDELFEVYQANFQRQQTTALNLQKHVKHYLHCLKELHEASKGLSQCLLDMHERDWPKHDVFENNAYELDHINEDLEEKLKESVLVPLEQYLGQFVEIREKISKRGRKLVDYDSQRHKFEASQNSLLSKNQHQNQQQNSNHPQQQPHHHSNEIETKLSKARDQLDEARKVYETLNNELHDELPTLYDNRLPFIITVFQRLFSSKLTYHQDSVDVQKAYLETVQDLAKYTEKGGFYSTSSSTTSSNPPQTQLASASKSSSSVLVTNNAAATATTPTSSSDTNIALKQQNNGATNNTDIKNQLKQSTEKSIAATTTVPTGGDQQQQQTDNKGPVYLHKVRATYKYLAEDEDELSFEAGEIIQVIEYDDPQEQEEGWLMGIKESNGQKGLFPANFTKEV